MTPALVDQICEIILEHDSRHEAISHNDALVKDSDKLWRFSREAIRIDPLRFRVDAVAHVVWLGRQIDGWFLTATGKNMALAEQKCDVRSFRSRNTSSRTNVENRLVARSALTWCPGQWHPISDQHRASGATNRGFVRSVFDLADYSLFDSEPE